MTAEIESYIKVYLKANPNSTTKQIYIAISEKFGRVPFSAITGTLSESKDIVLTGQSEYETKRGNTVKSSVWSIKDLESKLKK